MHKSKTIVGFSFLASSIVLFSSAGCFGGASGGSGSTAIPVGVYEGTGNLTVSGSNAGQPVVFAFITPSGSYMLVSQVSANNFINEVNAGTGTTSNGTFTSSNNANFYSFSNGSGTPAMQNYEFGTLSATSVSGTGLSGTIVYPATNTSLSFPLQAVTGSTQASSLSTIAGTYSGTFYTSIGGCGCADDSPASTFTISSTGALSGTVAPTRIGINAPAGTCTVTGTVTPRTEINAYNFTYTFTSVTPSTCETDLAGYTANGYGYYNAQTKTLIVGAINAAQTMTFNFLGAD